MLNIKKLEEEGRIRSFTYGLKSCVNTGNFSSKTVTIEYVIDKPTVVEMEGLKDLVKAEILEEENLIIGSIEEDQEVSSNEDDEIKLEAEDGK